VHQSVQDYCMKLAMPTRTVFKLANGTSTKLKGTLCGQAFSLRVEN